jgi:hypothetical protein
MTRHFEGAQVLQALLTKSGTLADVDDVVAAFQDAVKTGVPPQVVISALWEDEPRFSSPADARALFSNLLGLFDLIASGTELDLKAAHGPIKREKAARPEPFGEAGPDDDFVEAAWRYFDDHPKEYEKLVHQFDHRQDGLVVWLEQHGLDDDAFMLARQLTCEVFAMLELGGHRCVALSSASPGALPAALATWVEEGVFEAEQHDERPLPSATGAQLRELVSQACSSLWMKGVLDATAPHRPLWCCRSTLRWRCWPLEVPKLRVSLHRCAPALRRTHGAR